jgi:hypothetical protein
MAEDGGAYAQPTPRTLYVHDDLSDEVAAAAGPASPAAALARELLALLAADHERVRVLTLAEQVERVAAQGPHAPFEMTLGIGGAGERVARALHARTGWFPRLRRVGLTREEDGAGDYRLISTEPASLAAQLEGTREGASLAVVDDTVFSGLTMSGLIEALDPPQRARTRAFCLRGVAESIARVAALCPITAGLAAPGRRLHEVSFINASGLVRRIAIRRPGRPSLAFFDRPEWIRAWFPSCHAEALALCRRLNALLEPTPLLTSGGPAGSPRDPAARTGRGSPAP